MSCEYPVLCPSCGGQGAVGPVLQMQVRDSRGQHLSPIDVREICTTCSGDGEVCPAKRDAYRGEHGPDC